MYTLNNNSWPNKNGIYRIHNKKNNKNYIGSAVNLNERLKQHYYELITNQHFNDHLQRSFNKYGLINFEVEIIEIFDSPIDYKQLLKIEEKYILKFNSINPKNGYNKRLNSAFPELSEESKKIRNEKHNLTKIKIMLFEEKTGEFFKEFNSITEAANFLHDQTTNISKCCGIITRSCKGYVIIKSSEYDSTKSYKKQKVKRIWTDEQKQKQLENSKNTINVWLYDMIKNTKEKFLSASKIDNLFNFPKSTISHRFKNQNEFKYKNYLISKNEYELGSKELQTAFDNSYNYEPGIVKNQFTK